MFAFNKHVDIHVLIITCTRIWECTLDLLSCTLIWDCNSYRLAQCSLNQWFKDGPKTTEDVELTTSAGTQKSKTSRTMYFQSKYGSWWWNWGDSYIRNYGVVHGTWSSARPCGRITFMNLYLVLDWFLSARCRSRCGSLLSLASSSLSSLTKLELMK